MIGLTLNRHNQEIVEVQDRAILIVLGSKTIEAFRVMLQLLNQGIGLVVVNAILDVDLE
jgi:hypothetical protein